MRIVLLGDPDDAVLRRPAARVRGFGAGLHRLLDEMRVTLRGAHGVGLAGPQVGVSQRVIVIECPADPGQPGSRLVRCEFVNPKIVAARGRQVGQEGCLSLPELVADVERYEWISVRAQDRYGAFLSVDATGYVARVIQHEVDHLAGRLMTDRALRVYKPDPLAVA